MNMWNIKLREKNKGENQMNITCFLRKWGIFSFLEEVREKNKTLVSP